MHTASTLLEEALKLTRLEDAALEAEDVDQAEELSMQREDFMRRAWEVREGCNREQLIELLVKMLTAQDALLKKAGLLQDKMRKQMSASQKQSRYFNSDRYVYALSRKSTFCDKVS